MNKTKGKFGGSVEINSSHMDQRSRLIDAYHAFLHSNTSAKDKAAQGGFGELYLQSFPVDAWLGRELSDLHGLLHGLWHFLQVDPSAAPHVSVFNPNIEEHGWTCGRTVITVLQRDMPFLVDSIRLELNRRNIPLYVVQSTVLSVVRDAKGKVASIALPNGDPLEGARPEALLYIEAGLHNSDKQLNDIRRSLELVLADVDNVVADYQPLLEQLATTKDNLQRCSGDAEEHVAFLDWLQHSHFTFLGYREYALDETSDGSAQLTETIDRRLGLFRKLDKKPVAPTPIADNAGMAQFHAGDELICFSKSSTRSSVHRGVYPDYIVVKRLGDAGQVIGEARFLGLFTHEVFGKSPLSIPLLRRKVEAVIKRTKLDLNGYYGKKLIREIDMFPKEELFQSDEDSLFRNITAVASINERHLVRLIVREDPFGSFVNCMVFVPRDLYSTEVRVKVQDAIGAALGSNECDATSFFSESTLARAQYVFRIDDASPVALDVPALEAVIRDITSNWESHLQQALIDHYGESRGFSYYTRYQKAFSKAYQEAFDARAAVSDIAMLEKLSDSDRIAMSLYRPIGAPDESMRFKVLHSGEPLELSRIIPILEHLGFRVIEEHPYKITRSADQIIWMHDFSLDFALPVSVDVHAVRANFEDAFANILQGHSESDGFNRLVLGARLSWREVFLLRAYANYLKQTGFVSTQQFIADTLVQHPDITRNLIALFRANFDPRIYKSGDYDTKRIERLQKKIETSLDGVANLNEDLTLRRYLALINATLRTNYFQTDGHGCEKNYLSIKFSPREIPGLPEPRPMFEIFVYSPRVEGVHLRGGKVARGGLRWSDRLQDYRTEVLGLVKAQQVKNAVIVPSGAKGGFVAKQISKQMGRDEYLEEGIACYKTFIRGLLDVTDNLIDGEVYSPGGVIPKDWEDPYLVVAADRGTATFSDIANEIAQEYNFWLGDAFASGGSQGYDHKGMGITARGAWISVQRHFREQGIDIQTQDFSVIGIGDMAGDVFGNGMLLSRHICLKAAFNHQHIFIDPEPHAASSYEERQRLFAQPRSSWLDYNHSLISSGGGVFSRADKSIRITREMKSAFDIADDVLTPNDLIQALLKAPVDLIWNGGIGTYVKASWESHSDVGDKANDSLRVDGNQLRCKVFGEGGNLGLTQQGRVEFALGGGACNTDFIDNAGGVDCSDHEVNIKILLDGVVANGDLTSKQRNRLLADMTDDVAMLVLRNNYRQTLSLSLAEYAIDQRITEYRRFINDLEAKKRLSRKLEFVPSDDVIVERQSQGKGLTRPELSVLISYAKVVLKDALIASDISEDPYIARDVETAFPSVLVQRFPEDLANHRLRREIVGTQIANDLINNLGITAAHRLIESTGSSAAEVARAYIVSRDVFRFEEFQFYISSLDNVVPAKFQYELMSNMIRRVRRGTRWFLRNHRAGLDPAREVAIFRNGMFETQQLTESLILGEAREEWQRRREVLLEGQVSEDWVSTLAMPGNLFSGLSIVQAGRITERPLPDIGALFYRVLEELSLTGFATQVSEVTVENYWQAIAREAFIDDLEAQLRKITCVLALLDQGRSVDELFATWTDQHRHLIKRWRSMANEVQSAPQTDYAMFSVAIRELIDLAQATEHVEL